MNLNFKGKRALIRVDFNVPLGPDGNILDDTRIVKSLPTLQHILDQGGSVILMSHLGRPLSKLNEDGSIQVNKFTLKHLVDPLKSLLGREVFFAPDCAGDEAARLALGLRPGEVLLLENTRFYAGETKGDRQLAEKLAGLGHIFVNDAFGAAHRAHSSTAIVADFFTRENKTLGFLMRDEIENANRVMYSPARPLTAILGGAKVSDKIQLISRLIEKANTLIIGGGMAYTFMKAKGGETGNSLLEENFIELAKELLDQARKENVEILLPEDSRCAAEFSNDAEVKIYNSDAIPAGWMGLDIGPKAEKAFNDAILKSGTILWNGPLGVFEFDHFSKGTFTIAACVAEATKNGAYSLIGGGDSVAAINKAGLADEVSFISTGGGAMLEYLEGKKLPGIAAIES
ncbi:MAG TPA: phosphoglycerate kinase [Saprospiraceae bacterium]|nr:phosphoglycerate kinase [Saprospiraceae bacterium]